MGRLAVLCCVGWMMVSVGACAQSSVPARRARGAATWPVRAITFSNEKALMGLPGDSSMSGAHCSTDGITYIDFYASQSAAGTPPELYSISASGEVKHLRRELPKDLTSVSIRDFFAAEHTLVTLLEAHQHDASEENDRRAERSYFLSTSDHDGASGSVVRLDVKFHPLKVALFGSGDFLVLGWDDVNLLPVLALVKEDGTVRRFMDLDTRKVDEAEKAGGAVKEASASAQARASLELLRSAAFVPFDGKVLLTYPGTARGIKVLSLAGEERTIPIELPAGFLLHDVLVSNRYSPLIVRTQAVEDYERLAKDGKVEKPRQRLFEMDSTHGSLIREFTFDKPHPQAVVCAAYSKLTAIFFDVLPDSGQKLANAGDKDAKEAATQMVISTVPR